MWEQVGVYLWKRTWRNYTMWVLYHSDSLFHVDLYCGFVKIMDDHKFSDFTDAKITAEMRARMYKE